MNKSRNETIRKRKDTTIAPKTLLRREEEIFKYQQKQKTEKKKIKWIKSEFYQTNTFCSPGPGK